MRAQKPLADAKAEADVGEATPLGKGYFRYERLEVTLKDAGAAVRHSTADIVRGGRVAAVLPYDPQRNEIVLIHQFRLTAHLALGLGEMVEIVAGRLEPGEDITETARRECVEEIGLAPLALKELITYLPTPGVTDEAITIFLGIVDAENLPERAGMAGEQEETKPVRVSIDAALEAVESGRVHNGNAVIALQWLALNRERLRALAAELGAA
ncbi:MAG: NUDIX domain-containing protein [Bradyrhizobiaceae bacterium]|nr:NUDIX domain-containing protein [Bradyrhizobiaceae bacterium]